MRAVETAYVVAAVLPLAYLGLLIKTTPGSLVSGIAIGAVIPLLAFVSLVLVLAGVVLIVVARRRRARTWHLVLATLVAGVIPALVGIEWLT